MDFVDVLRDEFKGVVGYDLYSDTDSPNESILDYKIEELFNPWDIIIERVIFSKDLYLRIKGTKAPIARFVHKLSDTTKLETDISKSLADFLKDVISYNYIRKDK